MATTTSSHFRSPLLLALILFCVALLNGNATASTSTTAQQHVSSSHLVTGETISISYVFKDLPLPPLPATVSFPAATLSHSSRRAIRQNGSLYHILSYSFKSDKAGDFTIPKLSFQSGADTIHSQPIQLHIYPLSSLQQGSAISNGNTINFFSLFKADKSSLYPNEATQVEFKIYLPNTLSIALWGLPLGDKSNCTAWRFETPTRLTQLGWMLIKSKSYQIATYRSTLTATAPGSASLGPLRTRIVHHVSHSTQRGFRSQPHEFHLVSRALNLDVKKLPPHPPASFRGDVGSFRLQVHADSPASLKSTESISLTAQIIGSGNLATLHPPQLDLSGWKQISLTKKDPGEARKNLIGSVEFTYLLQPLIPTTIEPATTTPSVSFSYLDPQLGSYQTLSSPGSPILIIPSPSTATASQTTDSEASSQQDILGIIPLSKASSKPWFTRLPSWSIHLLPALLTLLILLRQWRKYHLQKQLANSRRSTQQAALKLLAEEKEGFLKAAAAYIERWIDIDNHPDAKDIITYRDKTCYQPETTPPLSRKKRAVILDKLKKLSLILCISLAIAPQADAQTATQHYANQHYQKALTAFQEIHQSSGPSADVEYNIGNCYYRLNQPGRAAAHYHRALRIQPQHPEASQNLRFLENKFHSITPPALTETERWIGSLSLSSYKNLIFLSLWLILLAILSFKYLRPRRWKLTLTIIVTILSPMLFGAALFGYLQHPQRSISQLPAAVIAHNTTLRAEPSGDSKTITTAPTASRCHLITTAGTFSYIELANKTRGWVLTENTIKL